MNVTAPRRWRTMAFAAALVAVLVAVYWPGLSGGFAFDDFPNIVDNARVHVDALAWDRWLAAAFSSPSSDLQRPLAMLSFALNHYFTGLAPAPMKATNLALHALNALLAFGLARRVVAALPAGVDPGRARAAAAFAAAAWALHPINLMPVLYVVQRMESLAHTFVFAGLWLHLDGRARQREGRPGWARVLAGLGLGSALGLLAKESAVLLPLYAFALEVCVLDFRAAAPDRDRRLLALHAGLLVLPAVAGLAWLAPRALDPARWLAYDFGLRERLLTEPRVVLDYLRWTLLPDLGQLSLYHDDYEVSRGWLSPPSPVPAMAALALLALGIAWFLAAQALTATFIPLELVYEHRNYFAAFGVCLALADLLVLAPARPDLRRGGAVAACALVLVFAALTHLRAREWSHPVRFTTSEAAKHPRSPRATYDLARTLVMLGRYDPDSPYTREAFPALERARAAPRAGVLPVQATLLLAARTGRPLDPAWWDELQARLREGPGGPQANAALASLTTCAIERLCAFPVDRMLATFDAAAAKGARAEVLNIRGSYVLNALGDADEAERLWREAAARNPNEPQFRISLARLLIARGRPDAAREEIARLRAMGRLGQNEAAARELEARLQSRAPPR